MRRASLCGEDLAAGRNFEHWRGWIVERMEPLAGVSAVDVAVYAIMSTRPPGHARRCGAGSGVVAGLDAAADIPDGIPTDLGSVIVWNRTDTRATMDPDAAIAIGQGPFLLGHAETIR